MQEDFGVDKERKTTLHSWSAAMQNLRFDSLEAAVGHCRHHISDLSAIELFVHWSGRSDEIISGEDLEMLVRGR